MHVAQVVDLARYNLWMNERLYAVCAALDDAQRREDRGLFFKSIHGTLNHLLLADRVWFARFAGKSFPVKRLDQELYADFAELHRERHKTDEEILLWAQSLSDDFLAGTLQYVGIVDSRPRRYEMWLAVTHFFNHQTHHRGQITAALSQLGQDYGVTDLLWMPEVLERQASAE